MSTHDFTINKVWLSDPSIKLVVKFLFFHLKSVYNSEMLGIENQ